MKTIQSIVPGMVLFLCIINITESQDYQHEVENTYNSRIVQSIFTQLENYKENFKSEWKNMAKIYSPSGNEKLRAEYIVNKFKEYNIPKSYIDQHGNAIGLIEGKIDGPTVVFLGTMDDLATVAEIVRKWDKPIKEDNGKLIGPGTNSSATCATLLSLARVFALPEISVQGNIYLVGVVQEETGLTGIKGFVKDHPNEIDYIIDIMAGIGHISYGALGIHWFKIHFSGPKGHTLGGGLPNVTRAVAKAVDGIFSIPLPLNPPQEKVYLNITMLGAGSVYNHKSDDGWFSIDLRSQDNGMIKNIKDTIFSIVEEIAKDMEFKWWVETYSESPAGQIPGARDSRLVRIAEESTKLLGSQVSLSDRGSSNMNVGIINNIPSISTGGRRGGKRNTTEEYANIEPVFRGVKLNFLIGFILAHGDMD